MEHDLYVAVVTLKAVVDTSWPMCVGAVSSTVAWESISPYSYHKKNSRTNNGCYMILN